jgi:hypothetical protein
MKAFDYPVDIAPEWGEQESGERECEKISNFI